MGGAEGEAGTTSHQQHLPVCSALEFRPAESRLVPPSLGAGGTTNPSPEFSQAKFDMSSFIGGIILVLCVQAGGLLAMRFLKSKEQSSYDPM